MSGAEERIREGAGRRVVGRLAGHQGWSELAALEGCSRGKRRALRVTSPVSLSEADGPLLKNDRRTIPGEAECPKVQRMGFGHPRGSNAAGLFELPSGESIHLNVCGSVLLPVDVLLEEF